MPQTERAGDESGYNCSIVIDGHNRIDRKLPGKLYSIEPGFLRIEKVESKQAGRVLICKNIGPLRSSDYIYSETQRRIHKSFRAICSSRQKKQKPWHNLFQ